jgi:hypothetical protein
LASTITIQATINWEASFIEQQPVMVNGEEPAISSAQLIMQTILGPPFSWPWNRGVINYTTDDQDYTVAGLTDFGFLEGGSVQATDSGSKFFAIAVKHFIENDASQARPTHASAYIDDGAGNITFRLIPSPDRNYNVTLPYQKKCPLIYSLGQTWAPIPDEKNYICQWGHLALMSLIGNDARFNEYNTKFVTSLLSAQGGLSEMERNLFVGNWLRVAMQLQTSSLAVNERMKAREV